MSLLTQQPHDCIADEQAVQVGLFFSDTGGGHRSATEAIEAAIKQILADEFPNKKVSVSVEAIVERSHWINRYFVMFYNYLLRRHQYAMRYYYWFIETFKPNSSELGWVMTRRYVLDCMRKLDARVVVSVHPMSNQYLSRALHETGLRHRTKLVTVVTDPNGDFWSGWSCPDADLTIVPNDLAKNRLIHLGVDPEKIAIMGMPVHPDFCLPPHTSPQDFKASIGLDPHLPTICVNAGWAGGGNMIAIYKALAKVKRKIQVVFLCGHNRDLYHEMKTLAAQTTVPTAVLPFHDKLSDLMAACDLMVTKAGGLTTFEAIARRLPMAIDMITVPMPQEIGTGRMLVENGLANAIYNAEDIIALVEQMPVRSPDQDFQASSGRMQLLPRNHQLDKTGAVFEVARAILRLAGCATSAQAVVETKQLL